MDEDALETLLQALSTAPRDRWFVLPGAGWISVKHYRPYEGRTPTTGAAVSVPDKRLAWFTTEPDIDRALAGLPPGIAIADDRTRYLRAIRPDGNEDEDRDDPATMSRTPGAETIGNEIRSRLLAGEVADIPGLGVFDILEQPSRRGADPDTGAPLVVPARRLVRFLASESLKARLNPASRSD